MEISTNNVNSSEYMNYILKILIKFRKELEVFKENNIQISQALQNTSMSAWKESTNSDIFSIIINEKDTCDDQDKKDIDEEEIRQQRRNELLDIEKDIYTTKETITNV